MCSLLDVPCHITTTVAGWWAAIPLDWLFWGVFGAGLVLGAILGKWGVAALIGALALFAAFSARPNVKDPIEHLPDNHPDAQGPFQFGVNKVRRKPIGKDISPGKERKRGETAADRWEARE